MSNTIQDHILFLPVINVNSELLLKIALAERPLNPDQQINHGCNLKWKLGQDEEDLFLIQLLVHRQTDLTDLKFK